MNNIIDKKGVFLSTVEFYDDIDEEVGHIRYWYCEDGVTKEEMMFLFGGKSENTYEVALNFPNDNLEEHSLYIHHLYVNKEYRRKGYATEMINHLIYNMYPGINQVILAYDESYPWLVKFYKQTLTENVIQQENNLLFNF